MAEYIERNALRKALYDAGEITFDGLKILDEFPAADVQPVVRCKDCQYWQESRYGIIEMNACLRFDSPLEKDGFIFKANAEDFCSFAKRRVEA